MQELTSFPGTDKVADETLCYHCGDVCHSKDIVLDEKLFCCEGCKIVYDILQQNNLCNYYDIENHPGVTRKGKETVKSFDYLDDERISTALFNYHDEIKTVITFLIPDMHCSSCIWLLENLHKFDSKIISSRVNFLEKNISITYDSSQKLSKIVSLLTSIGYEPSITNDDLNKSNKVNPLRSVYYKLGVAGFAFGNIMMLTFPEYLSIDTSSSLLKIFFAYLILLLSLPVLLYSASGYLISAYKGLKKKVINIDVPLGLGIIVLFGRSAFEIVAFGSPAYMDSFAGLIFFLLLGKLFQEKTYQAFNFERNIKSYFPISVTKRTKEGDINVPLEYLQSGDKIIIKNNEIIPADAYLLKGEGSIDYSFVTGEATPVKKEAGDKLFAGGKQLGTQIEIQLNKDVNQSYLTKLWNDHFNGKNSEDKLVSFSNTVSKYFTIIIVTFAIAIFFVWFMLPEGINKALDVFTAVLIVACPCALALSTPFTMGNILRTFGKNNFYIKNIGIIEKLGHITDVVFDKTGTLTEVGNSELKYLGLQLSESESDLVFNLIKNSTHPLSRKIATKLYTQVEYKVENYEEISGAGVSGVIAGKKIRFGSFNFCYSGDTEIIKNDNEFLDPLNSRVHLTIGEKYYGYFALQNIYREYLDETIVKLKKRYKLHLLSGDNNGEKENLEKIFGTESILLFNQSPLNKKEYISRLHTEGKSTLMIGDGLNDAGALLESRIGVSVAENVFNFVPASDAILKSSSLVDLHKFLGFARFGKKIIYASFIISTIYNVTGITIAALGLLTPLIAAILMPLSSITVVVFTTSATGIYAKRKQLI